MGVNPVNHDLYTEIFRANVNDVYKTALHYSENQHTAEEIVQEVFYKLYLHIDHINVDAVSGWLLTTTRRMAMNYKRDHQREIPTEEVYEDTYDLLAEEALEDKFTKALYEAQCREFLDKILDEMFYANERWYDAVTITYGLGKPQKEVAEGMGVSVEGLHSMLHRVKKWVKKNYGKEYDRLKSR